MCYEFNLRDGRLSSQVTYIHPFLLDESGIKIFSALSLALSNNKNIFIW